MRYVGLEELLRTADLVSLHCPLTPETHHMIDADAIKMMRDSAILVNTSRGGLIDTHALIDALRQRKFAGVGLDVYETEDNQIFEDYSDDVLRSVVVPGTAQLPECGHHQPPGFFYPHGAAKHCHNYDGKCPCLRPRRKAGKPCGIKQNTA